MIDVSYIITYQVKLNTMKEFVRGRHTVRLETGVPSIKPYRVTVYDGEYLMYEGWWFHIGVASRVYLSMRVNLGRGDIIEYLETRLGE